MSLPLIVALAVAVVSASLSYRLYSDGPEVLVWLRLVPAVVGFCLAAGFAAVGVCYNIVRFKVLAGLVAWIGIQESFLLSSPESVMPAAGWVLALTGGLCLASGAIVFRRFLRSHPLAPEATP